MPGEVTTVVVKSYIPLHGKEWKLTQSSSSNKANKADFRQTQGGEISTLARRIVERARLLRTQSL